MNNFPPNFDPKIYTISAFIIGFALIDDFTASEQNAIGNWFITIGQILENNSAFQQMVEGRISGNSININSKKFKKTGDPYMDVKASCSTPTDKEIDNLKKIIKTMQDKIEELSKK